MAVSELGKKEVPFQVEERRRRWRAVWEPVGVRIYGLLPAGRGEERRAPVAGNCIDGWVGVAAPIGERIGPCSAGRFSQPQQYFSLTPNQPASQSASQPAVFSSHAKSASHPASQPAEQDDFPHITTNYDIYKSVLFNIQSWLNRNTFRHKIRSRGIWKELLTLYYLL